MESPSVVRKIALWVIGAVGVAPLIAEMVKRWANQNGYLDDPSKGLQWLLSWIAAFTEWWLFFPLAIFSVGLVAGMSIDTISRSRKQERASELTSLGWDMIEFANYIQQRANTVYSWPERIAEQVPALQSLFIRLNKQGFWTPSPKVLKLVDDGHFLHGYLKFTGTLLKDGHIDNARREIDQFKAEFKEKAGDK